MRFYKKMKDDGSLDMIGSAEEVGDGIEISELEYDELREYIKENAVHIMPADEEQE